MVRAEPQINRGRQEGRILHRSDHGVGLVESFFSKVPVIGNQNTFEDWTERGCHRQSSERPAQPFRIWRIGAIKEEGEEDQLANLPGRDEPRTEISEGRGVL
jgi:hypothetical protein